MKMFHFSLILLKLKSFMSLWISSSFYLSLAFFLSDIIKFATHFSFIVLSPNNANGSALKVYDSLTLYWEILSYWLVSFRIVKFDEKEGIMVGIL